MSDPSDPTPERPTSLTDVTAEKERSDDESGGQVSSAGGASLSDGAHPISDTDSVAGQPGNESGDIQEPSEAGPNAVPGGNRESNRVDHDIDHDDARPTQDG